MGDDDLRRSRSAGQPAAFRDGIYMFNNGDGVHEADVSQPPNWFKINGVEVRSVSPAADPPEGANPKGKWIMTVYDPAQAKFVRFMPPAFSGSRRRPSRKYKKSSKRVFRKKSRSTRRR
jgi:hypothetical protein